MVNAAPLAIDLSTLLVRAYGYQLADEGGGERLRGHCLVVGADL
jgi:hypothetical protein